MKPVIVTWDDAHASFDSISPRDAEAIEAYRTDSIGYLVCKTKRGVTLGYDRYQDGTFGGHTFIPAGMIVKIKELK